MLFVPPIKALDHLRKESSKDFTASKSFSDELADRDGRRELEWLESYIGVDDLLRERVLAFRAKLDNEKSAKIPNSRKNLYFSDIHVLQNEARGSLKKKSPLECQDSYKENSKRVLDSTIKNRDGNRVEIVS